MSTEIKWIKLACFWHDLAKNKDLLKRTYADKILRGKAFAVANDQALDEIQRN